MNPRQPTPADCQQQTHQNGRVGLSAWTQRLRGNRRCATTHESTGQSVKKDPLNGEENITVLCCAQLNSSYSSYHFATCAEAEDLMNGGF